ncbi:tetratricopeptide repeat protein [Rhizobium sp.]|jgi:uncharacterized protein|uniref:tetratricopeptide repeat protein n=1 Tax=Rhizobium sp. TaxID=391 RepID=UPI000E7F4A86|nr:hypothetical protein [Rhizobium sp.]
MKLAAAQALFVIMLMIGMNSARAGFDEGVDAYTKNDVQAAIAEWLPMAKAGDVKAQCLIGAMHAIGLGVAQDYNEAVRLYRLAAEQGNTYAQNNLGEMYQNGTGLTQDIVVAYALYTLSSTNNPSDSNKAISNRNSLAEKMDAKKIEAAEALSRTLSNGNIVQTIEHFLKSKD